jgi:hypothetical protein
MVDFACSLSAILTAHPGVNAIILRPLLRLVPLNFASDMALIQVLFYLAKMNGGLSIIN